MVLSKYALAWLERRRRCAVGLRVRKEILMELDWSEQLSHIRTLYRPWQPDDGYEEAPYNCQT